MRIHVFAIAALAMTIACQPTPPAQTTASPPVAHAVQPAPAGSVTALANAERARRGLAPLRQNPALAAAAQGHAAEMVARGTFSHTGANGSSVRDRVEARGYCTAIAAENIATGQPGAGDVIAGWMGSTGHRANLLNPRLTEAGVGQVGTMWVMVFARPCAG